MKLRAPGPLGIKVLSQEMWKAPKPGPVGYLGHVGEALRVPFWVGCKDGIALGGGPSYASRRG